MFRLDCRRIRERPPGATTWSVLTSINEVAAVEVPNVTVAPDSNPLPRIVTLVPPAIGPLVGFKYPIESGAESSCTTVRPSSVIRNRRFPSHQMGAGPHIVILTSSTTPTEAAPLAAVFGEWVPPTRPALKTLTKMGALPFRVFYERVGPGTGHAAMPPYESAQPGLATMTTAGYEIQVPIAVVASQAVGNSRNIFWEAE